MPRDLKGDLRNWKGFAPSWHPEPGEIIVGPIVDYSVGPGTYGDVNIVTIHDEESDEDFAVWLSSTVLLREFQRLEPKVGERVGIRYDGKHETKGYHRYAVMIDRDETDLRDRGGEQGAGDDEGVAIAPPFGAKPAAKVEDDDDIPF